MSVILQVTPHDPLIARDGRPFGAGQGNRMRGLPWPLPSVVAGSFRTALVKATPALDFTGDMPTRLMQVTVAGVFPVHGGQLYLPAPNDAVAEPNGNGKGVKAVHRVQPLANVGGCDFPDALPLRPVMLPDEVPDFKPTATPAWWPVAKYTDWLLGKGVSLDSTFLGEPRSETRDHVAIEENTGAARESQIFATTGLNIAASPRFGVDLDDKDIAFERRFAEVTLSARVNVPNTGFEHFTNLNLWHPLGGERRLVHWQQCQQTVTGWQCPDAIRDALRTTTKVRMILATPAIFSGGWKPGWLNEQLEGSPPGCAAQLKLVGVTNRRWKAVSGWSLAHTKDQPRGPKPIRRMVPAGSVYFFECEHGAAAGLADLWLQSVSDDEQERRDGFGLAVWGTWPSHVQENP